MNEDSSPRVQVANASKKALALRAITYRGKIDGPIGMFSLQQHFTNLSQTPLEIVYTFPQNSNMLIDEFHILLNGQSIHSKILPLDEAQKEYDDAVLKGDSAVYIQQHRSNIFTLNIGNLSPNDELIIQINLVQLLSVEGRVIRISLPTVIGPRYIPGHQTGFRSGFGWAEPTDRVPDADWITPPVSKDGVPYPVNFEIEVSKDLPVESVESPSHSIRFFPSDEGFKIKSFDTVAPDRDFILNLKLKRLPVDLLWQTKFDSQNIFLSWLGIPRAEGTEHADTDYFFLIDHSGSMAHEKLRAVKKAVRLCLRKLTQNDRFNLAVFDHNFMFWQNGWQKVLDRNIEKAELWLKKISANGGTELLAPLQKFFSMQFDPERRVVLVLLTDGEIGNEKEIASLFSRAPENLNVLLFGIDTAVNQELFNSIIENVSGMAEYIYPGEPMEQKITLQFERLDFPLFKQVAINGQTTKIFPDNSNLRHSTDLKPVLILTDGESENPLTLSIQLSNGDEHHINPTVLQCDNKLAKALKKFYVHFLLKKEIKELNKAAIHLANPRHEKRIKEKIIKLALEYQLQTELTAWYAYAEREQKMEGIPEIQIVPSALPKTWQSDAIFPEAKGYIEYDKKVKKKISSDDHFQNDFDLDELFSEAFDFIEDDELDYLETSATFVDRLLLTQKTDGSLSPFYLKMKSKVRATLLALLAVLNKFGEGQQEAEAYQSNLSRALKFILNHPNELSGNDEIILIYIIRQLHALNIYLNKNLEQKLNSIIKITSYNDEKWNDYFEKLKRIKLKKDSKQDWEQFVESVDNLFNMHPIS